MNTATRLKWTTAFVLLAFTAPGAASADAAQVRATLSSREAYVGVPVTLQVEIDNARSHDAPEVPDIAGAEVTSAGAPRRSSQTTIINGKVDERSSVTYVWQITPRHAGTFTIPPLQVKVDGRTETTLPQRFVATKSETGDLLYVEVSGQHDKVYVGQPLELKLKIWIKPYHDAEFDLTLPEGNMWQMIAEQTNWGAFAERMQQLAEENKRPGGEEVLRGDGSGQERSYYLYEIAATIYPKRPGQIDAGDVQVVVNYPTRLAKSRDPFAPFFNDSDFPFGSGSPFSGRDFSPFNRNTLSIADSRPLVAGTTVDATDVTPIPTIGRPADYRGAVGSYQIVTQAVPTSVKAGDPITLHIGVTGTGPMELVQAPPLASLPELTTGFKVPDEPLAGVVQDNAKLFTVSIRPRREGITEIPAIPLSFFDPDKEEFVTVHSDPIAIQVDKADTLALASIVGSANSPGGDSAQNSEQPNAASTLRLDNFTGGDLVRSVQPFSIWSMTFPMLIPPLVFFGFVIGRNWRRLGSGFAKFRFAAAGSACKALDAARSPSEISRTVLGYAARRLHSNPNTITRGEAVAQLRERGVAEGGERIDDLLAQCERGAYASSDGIDDRSLIYQAKDCIRWLSQQRLSQRRPHTPSAEFGKRSMPTAMLLIAVLATGFAQPILAADLNQQQQAQILSEANELYRQGRNVSATDPADAKQAFSAAAQKYQTLVDSGVANGKLYCNLANAYLQSGSLGRAIASYERAERFMPGDRAVATNLQYAQSLLAGANVTAETPSFWQTVARWNTALPLNARWTLALVAWTAVWLAAIGRWYVKGVRWRYVAVPGLAVSFLCIASLGYQRSQMPTGDRGIAVAQTVIRESNGEAFAAKYDQPLREGAAFDILQRRGNWLDIRTADGQSGWILGKDVEFIRPQ